MSVYCDPRPGKKRHWRYRIKIRLPNGRTERICGTPAINTKAEAQAAERAHIERVLRGHADGEPEEKEVLTLERFIDEIWWPTYPSGRGNRPTTIHEKEGHIRLHLKPALGRLLLTEVSAQKVTALFGDLRTLGHSRKGRPPREGLKRRRREEEKIRSTRERNRKPRGLKDKSIRNIRTTLSTILSSAVEWGYLVAMPRLPKVKVDDPQWEWYRAEEAKLLVAAARDEWERALLLFPLATGARMGEQIAIRWGDVDWRSRTVHIRQSAPGGGEIASTKSGRHRAVPLTPELVSALRAIEHQGEFVFVNEDGTRLRPGQFHELLWGAQRRAGCVASRGTGCDTPSRASSSLAARPCVSCSGGSATRRSPPASATATSRQEPVTATSSCSPSEEISRLPRGAVARKSWATTCQQIDLTVRIRS